MRGELLLIQERCRLAQLQIRLAQLDQRGSAGENFDVRERQNSHSELLHYYKLLAGILPKFPSEAEVPVWFEAAENALNAYDVPKERWGQIVFPLVADKVQFLSPCLAPTQRKDYEAVKQAVLDELKLSVGEYLSRFQGAKKHSTERWRAYTTRLQSYLRFYVEARSVSTFEQLLETLVADQLKNNLSDAALRYVTLQEGNGWRKATELAAVLLTFEDVEGKKITAYPRGE